MTEHEDEVIERIAGMLRPLPPVNEASKARVLVAVAAERHRKREGATRSEGWSKPSRRWVAAAVAVAAAAVVAVNVSRVTSQAPVLVRSAADTNLRLIARDSSTLEGASIPVQLVFSAPNAKSVQVVGDFNGWTKGDDSMAKDSASGLWSTSLALRPGRHVYAFVVDDTLWVRDPRAQPAPDADFGRPGSVVLVGRP